MNYLNRSKNPEKKNDKKQEPPKIHVEHKTHKNFGSIHVHKLLPGFNNSEFSFLVVTEEPIVKNGKIEKNGINAVHMKQLFMSPANVKIFHNILTQVIARYETKFGLINLPKSPQIAKIDDKENRNFLDYQ